MKIYPIHGTSPAEADKRWFVDFYEQWSGFFPPRNWVDFTVFDLNGEYSPYKGSCEASLAILGLRVTITYVYNTATDRRIQKEIDEMLGTP